MRDCWQVVSLRRSSYECDFSYPHLPRRNSLSNAAIFIRDAKDQMHRRAGDEIE